LPESVFIGQKVSFQASFVGEAKAEVPKCNFVQDAFTERHKYCTRNSFETTVSVIDGVITKDREKGENREKTGTDDSLDHSPH
jgi:hypothetical protein